VGRPGIVRANIHAPIETVGMTKDDMPALKEKVHRFMAEKLKEEGYR
jgi:hypothetical protein